MTNYNAPYSWRFRARLWLGAVAASLRDVAAHIRVRGTAHDRQWRAHPAVATDGELTFGQRAADVMRSGLGTWTFLIVLAAIMAAWIVTGGFGRDPMPFILLNLCLSTLAGIQAAVLLIAAKRSDQIAAATALHTLDNTESLKALVQQNTALTEQVAALTRAVHDHMLATPPEEPPHAEPEHTPDPVAPAPAGGAVAPRRTPRARQSRPSGGAVRSRRDKPA